MVWKTKSEKRDRMYTMWFGKPNLKKGVACILWSEKPNRKKGVACILCGLENQIWKKGLHLYSVVWKSTWSFQRAVSCQRFHCIFLVCCLLVPVFVIWTVRTLCHSLQAVLGSKDWRAFFIHIRFMLNTVNVYAWTTFKLSSSRGVSIILVAAHCSLHCEKSWHDVRIPIVRAALHIIMEEQNAPGFGGTGCFLPWRWM